MEEQARTRTRTGHDVIIVLLSENYVARRAAIIEGSGVHKDKIELSSCVVKSIMGNNDDDRAAGNDNHIIVAVGLDDKFDESWK